VSRHARIPFLLANNGGSFALMNEDFYPSYFDRHGCAWGEANGDGDLDFFCTQGANEGTGEGTDQLLIATRRGWEDRAEQLNVGDPLGRGRSVNWLDFDGDGDLDLFVGNKRRPERGNLLFSNQGDGFRKTEAGVSQKLLTVNSTWADWDLDSDPDLLVMQYPPAHAKAYENRSGRFESVRLPGITDSSWHSAAWGDYNGDGWPDLHLVGEKTARLLENKGGHFRTKQEDALAHGRMSAWFDVENDGRLDLFVVQGAPKHSPQSADRNEPDLLFVQRNGSFTRITNESFAGPRIGFGDAVSVADYNRDGKQDLFVTNGFGPRPASGPSLLLENETRGGNWAGLLIKGPDANPLGFGARLTVRAGGHTYRRQITDGFNFRSQSEVGYVHLGLGNQSLAHVRIRWPTGHVGCHVVRGGDIATLVEGSHPCRGGG
jgi:hypothetical protein